MISAVLWAETCKTKVTASLIVYKYLSLFLGHSWSILIWLKVKRADLAPENPFVKGRILFMRVELSHVNYPLTASVLSNITLGFMF